jgi:hypothetical protein
LKDTREDPFGRRRACPDFETLLALDSGALSLLARERATTHLLACDFCRACSQLLSNHTRRESPTRPRTRTPSEVTAVSPARLPLAVLTLALARPPATTRLT